MEASCVHKKTNIPADRLSTAESDLESVEAFEKSCASSGTTAQCCTLPVVSDAADICDETIADDLVGRRGSPLPRPLDGGSLE